MTRGITLAGVALLAGCAATPDPARSLFASEAAYSSVATVEVAIAPTLTAADLRAMQALDASAYAALRGAEASTTTEQAQNVATALAALGAFVSARKSP